MLFGGGQENARRAGTENVASIVALGKAAELAAAAMKDEQTRVAALRDRFEATVLETCPMHSLTGIWRTVFRTLRISRLSALSQARRC